MPRKSPSPKPARSASGAAIKPDSAAAARLAANTSPSATPAVADGVLLRGREHEISLRPLSGLERIYRYWTYVIANRMRFTDEARAALQERAIQD